MECFDHNLYYLTLMVVSFCLEVITSTFSESFYKTFDLAKKYANKLFCFKEFSQDVLRLQHGMADWITLMTLPQEAFLSVPLLVPNSFLNCIEKIDIICIYL